MGRLGTDGLVIGSWLSFRWVGLGSNYKEKKSHVVGLRRKEGKKATGSKE